MPTTPGSEVQLSRRPRRSSGPAPGPRRRPLARRPPRPPVPGRRPRPPVGPARRTIRSPIAAFSADTVRPSDPTCRNAAWPSPSWVATIASTPRFSAMSAAIWPKLVRPSSRPASTSTCRSSASRRRPNSSTSPWSPTTPAAPLELEQPVGVLARHVPVVDGERVGGEHDAVGGLDSDDYPIDSPSGSQPHRRLQRRRSRRTAVAARTPATILPVRPVSRLRSPPLSDRPPDDPLEDEADRFRFFRRPERSRRMRAAAPSPATASPSRRRIDPPPELDPLDGFPRARSLDVVSAFVLEPDGSKLLIAAYQTGSASIVSQCGHEPMQRLRVGARRWVRFRSNARRWPLLDPFTVPGGSVFRSRE